MKIFLTFVFLFSATFAFAQTQICDEDFEGVSLGAIPQYDPTGSGEIDIAGRPFYGTAGAGLDGAFVTGGNPGQCARAYVQSIYIGGSSYNSPKFQFNNRFGGTEVYLKFDMKMDPALEGNFRDFKFITITDSLTAADSVPWQVYLQFYPGSRTWSIYSWGGGEYYMANATTYVTDYVVYDGAFHTYEVYYKLGTYITSGDRNDANNDAIFRAWVDGTLVMEDFKTPARAVDDHYVINSVGFVRHLYRSAGDDYTGNLWFDNLEVWDGMPSGSPDPDPPPTLDSVTISGDGTSVIMSFSRDIAENSDGSDWTFSMSHGSITLSSPVIVEDTIQYTLSRTVFYGEELSSLAYTQPGNGVEDTAGGVDLSTIGSYSGTFDNGSDLRIKPMSAIRIGMLN